MKTKVLEAMKKAFRPEFLNRIDAKVVFHPLSKPQIREIVDMMLRDIEKQVLLQGFKLEVTPAARDWLGEKGYDPEFGARPLRRVIQERMEDSLSEALLRGEFQAGDTIRVDIVEESNEQGMTESKLNYEHIPAPSPPANEEADASTEEEKPAVATS